MRLNDLSRCNECDYIIENIDDCSMRFISGEGYRRAYPYCNGTTEGMRDFDLFEFETLTELEQALEQASLDLDDFQECDEIRNYYDERGTL